MKLERWLIVGIVALSCPLSLRADDDPQTSDQQLIEALEELEQVQAQHIEILTGLLNQVPESAKPGIQRAIANSRKGLERSQLAQQGIRGKNQTAANNQANRGKGKPEGVGKPGQRGGRPDDVGQNEQRGGKPQDVGQGKPSNIGQNGGDRGNSQRVGDKGKSKGKSKR